MRPDSQNPQTNIAKIPFGSGLAGGIAAAGLVLIILIDIPQLWFMAPAALALGGGIALLLHFIYARTRGASPWTRQILDLRANRHEP